MSKLTPRQKIFLAEFLRSGEVTASARRAGYKTDTSGTSLMRQPAVKAALAARAARVDVKATDVLARLKRFADAEPSALIPAAVIVRATELLGKHLALFREKIEIDAGPTLAQLIERSLELRRLESDQASGALPDACDAVLTLPAALASVPTGSSSGSDGGEP